MKRTPNLLLLALLVVCGLSLWLGRGHKGSPSAPAEVPVGVDEGLKHDSSIHCDKLISLPKASLTHFIGILTPSKIEALNRALGIAVGLDSPV